MPACAYGMLGVDVFTCVHTVDVCEHVFMHACVRLFTFSGVLCCVSSFTDLLLQCPLSLFTGQATGHGQEAGLPRPPGACSWGGSGHVQMNDRHLVSAPELGFWADC
jgi:hypothetical protein